MHFGSDRTPQLAWRCRHLRMLFLCLDPPGVSTKRLRVILGWPRWIHSPG